MKIHIIGCSGSGKTYLASALSQKYHIPHFDLDDIIYFLDMPGYLYKHRIILRFIKRKLGIQHGKKETLKSLYHLLKWTDTFQNKNRKEIEKILNRYGDKVVWLSSKKEVQTLINTIH